MLALSAPERLFQVELGLWSDRGAGDGAVAHGHEHAHEVLCRVKHSLKRRLRGVEP